MITVQSGLKLEVKNTDFAMADYLPGHIVTAIKNFTTV